MSLFVAASVGAIGQVKAQRLTTLVAEWGLLAAPSSRWLEPCLKSQACLLGATLSCAALVMVAELISMKCPLGPWSKMNMPCHGVNHKSWDVKGIAACRFAWPHTSTVLVRLKHG